MALCYQLSSHRDAAECHSRRDGLREDAIACQLPEAGIAEGWQADGRHHADTTERCFEMAAETRTTVTFNADPASGVRTTGFVLNKNHIVVLALELETSAQ